jgi:hypothetical protein
VAAERERAFTVGDDFAADVAGAQAVVVWAGGAHRQGRRAHSDAGTTNKPDATLDSLAALPAVPQ